ncbi:MAG: aspartyl protease family protein [Marinirhabdus sp.]
MFSIFVKKIELRAFLEEKSFYRVPLKKLATGHYSLVAAVNGIDGNFILDTGASNSCIGLAASGTFLLKNEASKVTAAGAGGTGMATQLSRGTKVKIKEKKLKNVDFVIFDLSHVNGALAQMNEGPVQGIIGADVLKAHRAVIDYGRNCLYIK